MHDPAQTLASAAGDHPCAQGEREDLAGIMTILPKEEGGKAAEASVPEKEQEVDGRV